MTKKIIVTGGAGFIGTHTVLELIQAGFTPIIIDNFSNSFPFIIDNLEKLVKQKLTVYDIDCNDEKAMNMVFSTEKNIEGVIHFAAYKAVGESVSEPVKYYKNNIGSLVTLLKVMEKHQVSQLVFSSSCTVYGQPEKLPVTELTPIQSALSPYGNTKQIGEEILKDSIFAGTSLKAIALRYFNPIGAHESNLIGELPIGKPNNLVPFITQNAIGLRDGLTVFGDTYPTPDGSCIRDYIHVVDVAKAHVKALVYADKQTEKSFFDFFNLGTGKGNSVFEVINTFEKVSNKKLNYQIGPTRYGDVAKVYADVTKSKEILGWQTDKTLEDALLDAWNWQKHLKENNYEF